MLSILPYHQATTDFFKKQSGAWRFFSNKIYRKGQLQEFKTDLLKNTYKFDETSDASLYQKVQLAREKLGLQMPVTVYQAQYSEDINASIVYLNDEVHIVFSGRIIQLLSDEELLAVIAHELSHVQLYTQLDGDVEVADRIINAIANHQGSTPAHYETARLFKLYTEVFCDRGAYLVTGNYSPIITSLVKIATGLQTVNVDSYLKQAEEIFTSENNIKTTGISHPENFIRARAIWLWHTKSHGANPLVQQMIEGNTSIEEVDLFKQQQMTDITQDIVSLLLHPAWMQTPLSIALAKQYFGQLDAYPEPDNAILAGKIAQLHATLQDYLAYVLYDFTTVDKELENLPLAYAFFLADGLKLDKAFANTVKKEKKLTDKKVSVLKKQLLAEFHTRATLMA